MPSDDVNGKLDTIIKKIGENSERLESIETLLVGDVKDSGKIGLLERIRKVEEWIAKREWFEKVIIVAIVGNAIGLIFLLIQSSIK
jgi:hypothetical protein